MRHPLPRWTLRPAVVLEVVDRAHLSIGEFAAELGISKGYWDALASGRAPMPPPLRRALLAHAAFAGVDATTLWDVKPPRFEQLALPGTADDDARGAA
jgi:transcriptional regulator with XRE-family HTH domain